MRKKTLVALLMMAVLLMTTACSLVVKDETADGKRVVVDVAGRTADKATFMNAVKSTLDYNEYTAYMYQMYGLSNAGYNREAEYPNVVSGTFDAFVSRFVQLNKATELGFAEYTDEDNAAIDQKAQEIYDSYLEQIKSSYFPSTELEGDALTEALTAKAVELNITVETCRGEAEPTYLLDKLKTDAVKDVAVTDDEVIAAFDDEVKASYTLYTNGLMHLSAANALTDEVLTEDEAALVAADETGALLDKLLVKHLMVDTWGLEPFSEAEEAALTADAQARYDAYKANIAKRYFGGEADEATLDAKAEAVGITLKSCWDEAVNAALVERIEQAKAEYATIAEPTEADTTRNTALTTALSAYRSAQSNYGSIYNYGNSVYFVPEGYRHVKQILIAPAADETGALDAAKAARSEAQSALSTLSSEMSTLQTEREAIATEIDNYSKAVKELEDDKTADDVKEDAIARIQESIDNLNVQIADAQTRADDKDAQIATKQTELDAQQPIFDEADAEYSRLNEIAFEGALATVTEVQGKLAAGENVDALIEQYGTDARLKSEPMKTTGYAMCPGTTTLSTDLVAAAMALDTVGAYTEALRSAQGWHILIYAGDIESGAVAPETELDKISENVLSEKKSTAFDAQVETWIAEAKAAGQVKTHPELIEKKLK